MEKLKLLWKMRMNLEIYCSKSTRRISLLITFQKTPCHWKIYIKEFSWMEAKAVKPIFSQTIKRMFRLKEVLIYFSIVLLPVLVVSLSTNRGNDSLYAEMKSVQGTFFILSFLWLTGIPFIINLLALERFIASV